MLEPDRYLSGEPPAEISRALRQCDLLFFPSRELEGFGLPLLEAMASKVPAVASRIPSAVHIGNGAVKLVPSGDVQAFAEAAAELLSNAGLWRRARRRGYAASRRFRSEEVIGLLDQGVRWARDYAAKAPCESPDRVLEIER